MMIIQWIFTAEFVIFFTSITIESRIHSSKFAVFRIMLHQLSDGILRTVTTAVAAVVAAAASKLYIEQ